MSISIFEDWFWEHLERPFSGYGAHGPIWGPMGSMGLGRGALADGPWPIGLEDPPVGVYFRARGRWASRTPPWGYISGPEAIRPYFYMVFLVFYMVFLFLFVFLLWFLLFLFCVFLFCYGSVIYLGFSITQPVLWQAKPCNLSSP